MRSRVFFLVCLIVAAAVFLIARWLKSEYLFFAGYVVLQFIVLATAWNILGGYCGYVNFGSAAFFAVGAYTSVFFHKAYPLPVPVLILLGGVISGIVGLGMGYLTLRLRGAFFAIATLALAVVLQTLIVNWDYVGGSRGAYIIHPNEIEFIGPYIQYLFLLMLALVVVAHPARGEEDGAKIGAAAPQSHYAMFGMAGGEARHDHDLMIGEAIEHRIGIEPGEVGIERLAFGHDVDELFRMIDLPPHRHGQPCPSRFSSAFVSYSSPRVRRMSTSRSTNCHSGVARKRATSASKASLCSGA